MTISNFFLRRMTSKKRINGTKIIIVLNSIKISKELFNYITQLIYNAVEYSKYTSYFKKITFQLESENSRSLAYVEEEKIYRGKYEVNVNLRNIAKVGLAKELPETLIHELTHLRQLAQKTKSKKTVIQLKEKRDDFFSDSLEKLGKFRVINRTKFLLTWAYEFFESLFIEGFAVYSEEDYRRGVKYSIDYYSKIYEGAKGDVELIKKRIDKHNKMAFMNEKNNLDHELYELFQKAEVYRIGFHLVQTILFLDNYTLNELFHLHPNKLTLIYEKELKKINQKTRKNFEPLITLKSGKGIIDYSDFIKKAKSFAVHTKWNKK